MRMRSMRMRSTANGRLPVWPVAEASRRRRRRVGQIDAYISVVFYTYAIYQLQSVIDALPEATGC